MVTVTTIDPYCGGEWDSFVEKHPFGWITHLSGWKKVLEESFPHMKGHYLVARENGGIRSALPVFEVRSWLTGNRLVSVPFGTLCHPLVCGREDMAGLIGAVLDLARRSGSSYVEIRSMPPGEIRDARFKVWKEYKHHYLSLDSDPEDLKKGFDRTCVRQRINRGMKSNLQLATVEDEAGIREFFRLYVMTRKRLGLPPQPYSFIRSLWAVFSPVKQVEIQLAIHEGRAIAGILLFRFRDRVSAEFMVSDESYRDFSPNHLLFWNAICQAHEDGFKTFDFGRTSDRNASLMDFKKRWGTTIVDLPVYYFPEAFAQKKGRVRESMAGGILGTLSRNAPDSLLQWLGKICYRHLG